jgi:uncharacterized protein (TIGR03067 family)
MNKTCVSVLVILLAVGTSCARDDDAIAKEREQLKGSWKLISVEEDGEVDPEEDVRELNVTFVIAADELWISTGRNGYLLEIDPKARPKQLTLRRKPGDKRSPSKGLCIYSVDDKCLTICFGTEDQRPTEFKTKANKPEVVMVFRRESKKP